MPFYFNSSNPNYNENNNHSLFEETNTTNLNNNEYYINNNNNSIFFEPPDLSENNQLDSELDAVGQIFYKNDSFFKNKHYPFHSVSGGLFSLNNTQGNSLFGTNNTNIFFGNYNENKINGGLFGNINENKTNGGLFGNNDTNQENKVLFGYNNTNNTYKGLFGNNVNKQTTSNLFGEYKENKKNSLFGNYD